MLTRIRQLAGLSFMEWMFLSAAIILLPCVGMCLRFSGYRRTSSFLRFGVAGNQNPEHTSTPAIDQAWTIARMVGVAARNSPYRANCLEQSLVLQRLLALAGIPAEVKFGIPHQCPDQGTIQFTAHAWVEYSGVNLSDTETGRQHAVFTG